MNSARVVPSPPPPRRNAAIDLLRRLLGKSDDPSPDDGEPGSEPEPSPAAPDDAEETLGVACPSCGYLIEPPPTRNRRCPACREPIVVRQVGGRLAYLTEEALAVFVAERERETEEAARDTERRRWLDLAATVNVPVARRAKLAAAPPTAATVEASRELYTAGAERAVRKAAREKRWADVARIRRAQAAASYAAAGAPIPPPEDVVALHRDGMLALLKSFGAPSQGAELVSAGCCKVCRADDGKVFRIAQELREPRLPHPDCSKGLCGCDWWIGTIERKRRRRTSSPASR